jgi:hypothetical protein
MRRCEFRTLMGAVAAWCSRLFGLIAMGGAVELPSIKARSMNRRQGLSKLPADLIGKARDETGTQVTRLGLTFLGAAVFCLAVSSPKCNSAA